MIWRSLLLAGLLCCPLIAETEAEFAARYVNAINDYHARVLAKGNEAAQKLNTAKNLTDPLLRDAYMQSAKVLEAEANAIVASQIADEVIFSNEARIKFGKTLDAIRQASGLPLPGVIDIAIASYFFRETASHDGVPRACADLTTSMVPDIAQAAGLVVGGMVTASAIAVIEIDQISQEVEAWKAQVRAAFATSDAHVKRITRNTATDIAGMQATLDRFVDDDRTYQGKARDTAEMRYIIGLMQDIHEVNRWRRNGDCNNDNQVNQADVDIMQHNWGGNNRTLDQGDMNGDGVINLLDFLILSMEMAGQ